MSTQRISSLLQIPAGDLELLARRALNRIDAIHTVPDAPQMPVIYTNDPRRFGGYMPEREDSRRSFDLSRLGPFAELTLTHEIGHFLDHALGNFSVYLSCEPDSMFSGVRQALESTRAITQMRVALQQDSALTLMEHYQLQYWLDEREQWARAYAQYIAVKSGDAQLLQDLETSRNLGAQHKPDVFRCIQWDADDFAPVAVAVERMFQELGWMQ